MRVNTEFVSLLRIFEVLFIVGSAVVLLVVAEDSKVLLQKKLDCDCGRFLALYFQSAVLGMVGVAEAEA